MQDSESLTQCVSLCESDEFFPASRKHLGQIAQTVIHFAHFQLHLRMAARHLVMELMHTVEITTFH